MDIADAQNVKANPKKVGLYIDFCVSNDILAIASMTLSYKKKNWKSERSVEMSNNNLALNLKPLELDISSSSVGRKPQTSAAVTIDNSVDLNIPGSMQRNINTFAVIIGNEDYNKVAKVPFANNDADVFASYCRNTLGMPDKNVRVYKDATYATMLSAVDDIKNISKAYKGDIKLVFYYAGHGVPDESSGEAYLLPIDTDGRNIEVCYPLTRLYSELGSMNVRSVVVFMYACFSGSERGAGMLMAARGVAIKSKAAAPHGNMVVFSAACGDETAYPYNEKGHGLFTYFLLKKLQDTKGDVTLGDLGSYIVDSVGKESVVSNGKSQTPTIVPSQSVINDWQTMKLK